MIGPISFAVIAAFDMRMKIQRSNRINCVRLTLNHGLPRHIACVFV